MNIFKKIFNKKLLKIVWIVYALFSIAIIIYLTDYMFRKDLDAVSDKVMITENWDITIDDTLYEDVSLDNFHIDVADKGMTITMETTLPSDWDFVEPALCFHVRQTTVDMFINNQSIYSYGKERAALGKTVGSGIQLISFSNDYK